MIERVLHINQVFTSDEPTHYVCFGLGSCIGLFITDRQKQLSGGAHIPLPSAGNGLFQGATEIICSLLQQLREKGSSLETLRAKLAGGAHVYAGSMPIGAGNIDAVIKYLIENRIYIAAKDVGGTVSRTARFNSATGDLKIFTSEKNEYVI
jgi:chemotaxis protein CheD